MIEQDYAAKLYLYRELYNLAVLYDPDLAEAMKQKFEGYLGVVSHEL